MRIICNKCKGCKPSFGDFIKNKIIKLKKIIELDSNEYICLDCLETYKMEKTWKYYLIIVLFFLVLLLCSPQIIEGVKFTIKNFFHATDGYYWILYFLAWIIIASMLLFMEEWIEWKLCKFYKVNSDNA